MAIGSALQTKKKRQTWVQTERRAHEAWAALIRRSPTAAELMHILVAHMGHGNAVVASQTVLGELLGEGGKPVHRHTIRHATKLLEELNWIEIVRIGGKGGGLAYIVNDRVAWSGKRDGLKFSRFSAQVIVSESEQIEPIENRPALRQVPIIMRGETALPTGDHAEPPSQALLEGFEPSIERQADVDPETGEIQERLTGFD